MLCATACEPTLKEATVRCVTVHLRLYSRVLPLMFLAAQSPLRLSPLHPSTFTALALCFTRCANASLRTVLLSLCPALCEVPLRCALASEQMILLTHPTGLPSSYYAGETLQQALSVLPQHNVTTVCSGYGIAQEQLFLRYSAVQYAVSQGVKAKANSGGSHAHNGRQGHHQCRVSILAPLVLSLRLGEAPAIFAWNYP